VNPRYALYWTPPPGSVLAQLGESWLGRDAATDRILAQPALPGFTDDEIMRLTAEPRRYGLHATLKPPFRLAAGHTEADLEASLAAFTGKQPSVRAAALRIRQLDGFLALTPETPSAAINGLAAQCVEAFDCFRAPPEAEELARRRQSKLTPTQEENLRRWGYPYVMEDFRFHITLSGTLERTTAQRLLPLLAAHFAPAMAEPLAIGEIALFIEFAPGAPFRIIRHFSFGA
jgi:putative phosphonate metabolism protein